MQTTLRLLSEQDALSYKELRLSGFQESPNAFSESYEDEVTRSDADFASELSMVGQPPEWFVIGAFEADSKLIGFVKFRRDQRTKARHKSMIHAMYVAPNSRKKGVASALIQAVLEQIRALDGLEQIHLWVLHSDDSAADFYRKCGFKSQGTRVKGDLKIENHYIDAEYMVMYLNQSV